MPCRWWRARIPQFWPDNKAKHQTFVVACCVIVGEGGQIARPFAGMSINLRMNKLDCSVDRRHYPASSSFFIVKVSTLLHNTGISTTRVEDIIHIEKLSTNLISDYRSSMSLHICKAYSTCSSTIIDYWISNKLVVKPSIVAMDIMTVAWRQCWALEWASDGYWIDEPVA